MRGQGRYLTFLGLYTYDNLSYMVTKKADPFCCLKYSETSMETYLMTPIYNDLDFKNSWEADVWKSAVNFNIFHGV